VEAGALDGLTIEDIKSIEFGADDYLLVSRMRDGTEIRITKRFVLPLLQEKIHELEAKGVGLTVIMCTGKFPQFESRGLVVTPQEILKGVLNGTLKKGRLGVVYPAREQTKGAASEFGREDVESTRTIFRPTAESRSSEIWPIDWRNRISISSSSTASVLPRRSRRPWQRRQAGR